jgi:hypothetical protein
MKKMQFFVTLLLTIFIVDIDYVQAQKIEPRVGISYYKSGDDLPYVKIVVRKKVDRRFYPMEGVVVKSYFDEVAEKTKIGEVNINDKGEAIMEMPTHLMNLWHAQNSFEIIALIDETDSTEQVSESLEVLKARLKITTTEDSVINVILEQKTDENWIPVQDVTVKFFIKRDFGKLLITEDYIGTDENGTAMVEYNDDVPGDSDGKIVIGAMIEDHDEFGNLYAYTMTKWGAITVIDNKEYDSRSLWAARNKPPFWLLILANSIILGVWGVMAYLFLQILKIKKLSNLN